MVEENDVPAVLQDGLEAERAQVRYVPQEHAVPSDNQLEAVPVSLRVQFSVVTNIQEKVQLEQDRENRIL